MGQRIKQYYFKNEGIVYFDNPKISDAINKVEDTIMDMKAMEGLMITVLEELIGDINSSIPLDKRILDIVNNIKFSDFEYLKYEDAINNVFLSKSRIRHLFKEEMGISLMNYITWKRLIHASKSLVISQENITDTAYLYGFSDSSHFSRLPFAKVASRLFTEAEGGDQHCRVGNYDLALEYILSWLRETY